MQGERGVETVDAAGLHHEAKGLSDGLSGRREPADEGIMAGRIVGEADMLRRGVALLACEVECVGADVAAGSEEGIGLRLVHDRRAQ